MAGVDGKASERIGLYVTGGQASFGTTLLRGEDATRLVGRHFTRRSAALTTRWRAVFDLDLVQLLIVQVALNANLVHDRGGLLAPDAQRRPVSVMAVAQSMGLPHETVRRQALALAGRGLLVRGAGGLTVSSALFASEAGRQQLALAAADARAVAGELAVMGLAAARALPAAHLAALPDDVVARRFNDVIVLGLEPLVETFGDLMNAALFIQITAANVEHIADDPHRSRRFAHPDTMPDDAERRAITMRALSRVMEMPYATVHRRVAALVARGQVEPRDGGFIVPARALRDERVNHNNLKLTNHVEAMFAELARL